MSDSRGMLLGELIQMPHWDAFKSLAWEIERDIAASLRNPAKDIPHLIRKEGDTRAMQVLHRLIEQAEAEARRYAQSKAQEHTEI